MSMDQAPRLALVFGAAALATVLLARLAPALAWTDASRGSEAARKRQRRPVPAVGGFSLLLALAVFPSAWLGGASLEAAEPALWGPWLPSSGWRLATLLACTAVGAWDDRAVLGPGRKALAQLAGLAPIAWGATLEHGWSAGLGLLFLGLLALNVLNTFDNADGALTGLCALAFAPVLPLVSAACLGFLPFNLDAGRARNRSSGAPTAYLGDAGAFLLGALVLVAPRSAGVLVLPTLDLLRLAVLRWRAGSRPWIGDRRHLAHRLEGRGLARPVIAGLLWGIAAPASLLVGRAAGSGEPLPALVGLLATTGLFALALRGAPARSEGS